MNLLLYNCDNNIILTEDKIVVLEVENPKVFVNIIRDVIEQVFPAREIAFEENNSVVKSKDMICVIDHIGFDISTKTLLTKIYKHIENTLNIDLSCKAQYEQLVNEFRNNLLKLFVDIDIDFDSENAEIKDALGIIKLIPMFDSESILDKLLQYINICAELKLCKIIVLVNAKSYLNVDELKQLYIHSLYKKQTLVLLENVHREQLLENERKVFIDNDFCDIIYE